MLLQNSITGFTQGLWRNDNRLHHSRHVVSTFERLEQVAMQLTMQQLDHPGPSYSIIAEFDTAGSVSKVGLSI